MFDEFSNLADSLSNRDREELWRGARMVAAEGRKAGIHLTLALQDPTHRSIDLRIRRNCTPISFRVRDGEASRVILGAGGAETLPPRHFMTVLDDLIRGVAFAPEDDEIRTFLASRNIVVAAPPNWLRSKNPIDSPPLSSAAPIQQLAEQIRPIWEQGASKRAMARSVGKEYAGAFVSKLDAAIRYLDNATTASEDVG